MSTKYEKMKKIRDEVFNCQKCNLFKYATLPVVGIGNHNTQIMFIGEGPGANEDKTGVPFCGTAGKILDELLKNVGIDRKDVYITNIIKHRPPANRDPKPKEISVCVEYLDRQIDIIKPQVLCALGRFSAYYLMEKYNLTNRIKNISKMHGKLFKAKAPHGEISIVPLYHPAVAAYNANMITELKKDFEILKRFR